MFLQNILTNITHQIGVSLTAGDRPKWPAVRTILPTCFDYSEESFLIKKFSFVYMWKPIPLLLKTLLKPLIKNISTFSVVVTFEWFNTNKLLFLNKWRQVFYLSYATSCQHFCCNTTNSTNTHNHHCVVTNSLVCKIQIWEKYLRL